EAVALAKTTRPHVVLMDLAMPGKGGIEATRRIVALGIGAKILVLTALPQEAQLSDALEAGAGGRMPEGGPGGGQPRVWSRSRPPRAQRDSESRPLNSRYVSISDDFFRLAKPARRPW